MHLYIVYRVGKAITPNVIYQNLFLFSSVSPVSYIGRQLAIVNNKMNHSDVVTPSSGGIFSLS